MGLRRDLAGASARLTDMTGRYLLLYLVFTIYILNNSCILIMAVYGIHCGPVLHGVTSAIETHIKFRAATILWLLRNKAICLIVEARKVNRIFENN